MGDKASCFRSSLGENNGIRNQQTRERRIGDGRSTNEEQKETILTGLRNRRGDREGGNSHQSPKRRGKLQQSAKYARKKPFYLDVV